MARKFLPLALAAPMALVPAPAGATPPPGGVTIGVVTAAGSSCRPGTVAAAVSPDRAAFTVTYSAYLAQAGGGATAGEASQKCKLTLQIQVPAGVTYAVSQADYRGFAYLAAGATAVQRAAYRFQGDPQPVPVEHAFAGPYSDDWQTTDHTDPAALTYGPCGKGRKFTIDTELAVNAGTAGAQRNFIAMDSTDGSFESTYHFVWKACG
jgi:Domain of unknown function (DUF4360)